MEQSHGCRKLVLILGEIQTFSSILRRNSRWKSDPMIVEDSNSHWLINRVQSLRKNLALQQELCDDFCRNEIIVPFVEAVRSEETSGQITGAALEALGNFISSDIFSFESKNSMPAIAEIAEAVAHCRFEATDSSHDELVLQKILEVQLECIKNPAGSFLPDDTMWEMVQTCFRIYRQMKPPEYSDLLGSIIESSLLELINRIFAPSSRSRDTKSWHSSNQPFTQQGFATPCMLKVFANLCSMAKSFDNRRLSRESRTRQEILLLRFLHTAIYSGLETFRNEPGLLSLIKDDVVMLLLEMSSSKSQQVISWILRVFYLLFQTFRSELKMQIEVVFNTIFLRIGRDNYGHQELILESLLDFCASADFLRELYMNYDCCEYASNLAENLVHYICTIAYPSHGTLTSNHMIALKCVQTIIHSFYGVTSGSIDNHRANFLPLLANKQKKKDLLECIDIFNQKPKRGIEAFVSKGIMASTIDTDRLVQIMRDCPSIDKANIGQVIGEPSDFAEDVRTKLLGTFDFSNKPIDDALRVCLEGFRLPQETQQIDRVIQAFAIAYHRQNPTQFASADTVYVLTFSLIMLNTDAHNDMVKRKMTLEQFLNNNRGINDDEDLPEELLRDLYHSIKQNEIKISKAGVGGSISHSLWIDLLNHRVQILSPYVYANSNSSFDRDLFSILFDPVIGTISVAFDSISLSSVNRLCGQTLTDLAQMATQVDAGSAIDTIMLTLCQMTGLIETDTPMNEMLKEFSLSLKAQSGVALVFAFAHSYGEFIRQAWNVVFALLFRLLRLNLLPASLVDLDNFIPSNAMPRSGRSLSFTDAIKNKALSSIFSTMSSLLSVGVDIDDDQDEQMLEARRVATEHASQYRIEELVADTKYLPLDALLAVFAALANSFPRPSSSSPHNQPVDSFANFMEVSCSDPVVRMELRNKQVTFCLHMLCEIVVRNRDRVELFWTEVCNYLESLLISSSNEVALLDADEELTSGSIVHVLESVCVTIVSLCIKLQAVESESFPIISCLNLLVQYDIVGHSLQQLGLQILYGLLTLTQTYGSHLLVNPQGAQIYSQCLISSARYSHTYPLALDILNLWFPDSSCNFTVTHSNFVLFTEIIYAMALSRHGQSSIRRRVMSYFGVLHTSVYEMELSMVDVEKDSILLNEYCHTFHLPFFQRLQVLACNSTKLSVREMSLSTLESIFFSPYAHYLSSSSWNIILSRVMLPMLQELAGDHHAAEALTKCRLEAVNLCCKVVLQNLPLLLQLESDFVELWTRILRSMVLYLQSESLSTPSLIECVHESLKNLLLVLKASNVFDVDGDNKFSLQLRLITENELKQALPALLEEIFPAGEALAPSDDDFVEREAVPSR